MGGGLRDIEIRPANAQLFGGDLGQRRMDPLPHLHFGDIETDTAVI